MPSDTLRQVTGTLHTPTGEPFANKTLAWFKQTRKASPQGSKTVVDEPFMVQTDAAGAISFQAYAGNYVVRTALVDQDSYFTATILDIDTPQNIADLFKFDPVEADVYVQIEQSLVMARAWAENQEDVEVDPTDYPGEFSAKHHAAKAAASAAEAALYDGPWLDDVAGVLADTSLTYTAGQPGTVAAGDVVRTRKEGFSYEVVASGATDNHLITVGEVKLKVLRQSGEWPARAFGVAGDGVTDDTTAYNKAVAAASGGTLNIGDGYTYLLTEAIDATCNIVGMSDLSFSIPNNTDNCLTLRPASAYGECRLDIGTVFCNETGLDGVAFERGEPKGSFNIEDAYRDGLLFFCDAGRFDWIENMQFGKVRTQRNGRHGWHIHLLKEPSDTGVPFVNEGTVSNFEVRGVGRRFTGANPICVTFDGTNNTSVNKVSGITIGRANIDVDFGNAFGTVGPALEGKVANSGVGSIESIVINGGGFESASVAVTPVPRIMDVAAGINVLSIDFTGVITYQYCFDYGDAIKNSDDSFTRVTNGGIGKGAYFPKVKTKPNGTALKGESDGPITGFANAPVSQSFVLPMVASSSVTQDIPVAALTGFQIQEPIFLVLDFKGYQQSNSDRARGLWLISLSETGGSNYAHSWAIATDSANPAYSFDPALDVSFSMPDDETLRITISCGASVGAGGRVVGVRGCVSRGLSGTLQGALTNLAAPIRV
ncbi:hypothetical protein [Leisingera daeponensis]|uniref:hypothetical protein n=1 Tax=Leisingera daeponensis TaxID=405746 RepID=UPI001C98E100|nr:hypothetical protein [Leisingera daeponensis]MBY6055378.1 hypothetical protein [Leisingera daeponensis]